MDSVGVLILLITKLGTLTKDCFMDSDNSLTNKVNIKRTKYLGCSSGTKSRKMMILETNLNLKKSTSSNTNTSGNHEIRKIKQTNLPLMIRINLKLIAIQIRKIITKVRLIALKNRRKIKQTSYFLISQKR